jgi:X-Pro dipeptidyl-peptidase
MPRRVRLIAAAFVAVLAVVAAGPTGAAPTPTEPVFVDGQAQPVFPTSSAQWINEELWVETDVDSDGDGKLDRVHVDVSRVQETETAGLKVPVVMEASPYYAGNANVVNWAVDHEIGFPPATRPVTAPNIRNTSPTISTAHESNWVPRGFAVVHTEGLGSGLSQGCPSSGGPNETAGPKAVVDWLNGRARGYTSPSSFDEVVADWTTGRVGMIGTSYNGTLPIAVAATGVQGLEAIVPISAISSWYDYYRANGAVRAPGGFQGEDLDVLAEYVYTRQDQQICRAAIADLVANQDRVTGDDSAFWQSRNYMKDIDRVRAASLVAHGNNDWNVMTKHAAAFYEGVKARGVPHQLYWHQGGHGGSPPLAMTNRWFTRYLWNVENGVEAMPKAWVVREGQSSQSPTPYPEWPDPDASPATLGLLGAGQGIGELTFRTVPAGPPDVVVDNATLTAATLYNAATSPHRLVLKTAVLAAPVRISGTPTVSLRVAFGKPKANLTALLVNFPGATGNGTVVTRGWIDPENRTSPLVTEPVVPGAFYTLSFDLQPKDSVIAAGRRLGLVLLSSDREYSVRPAPGTELSFDLAAATASIPVVGGGRALAVATGVTAPTIASTLTPAAPTGENGWYTGDVSLAWQVGDGGAATTKVGCVDTTLSADGELARSCAATNLVGSAGPVEVVVKRDATAPAVSVTGVAADSVYVLGTEPAPGCSTTDVTSGVAVPAALAVAGGPAVGFFTATCATARDFAGNTGAASARYQVVYDFDGFFGPVHAGLNQRTAGSAVPVRFSLAGDQGPSVLAEPVSYRRVHCTTRAPIGPATAASIKEPGLVYDASSGAYELTWKTDRAFRATCGRLDVELIDGTTHSALFRFGNASDD